VHGQLRGVLQFVPWGSNGLSLDLMRGDRTADNGLTELMIVTAIKAGPELGVRRLSLNFAVLRSVFARAEELGAGPVLRFWHRLLRAASKLWQIESLYRANAKYHPAWQPRYLCFPTARDLPRIALAALTAEAFLPTDRRTPRVRHPDHRDAGAVANPRRSLTDEVSAAGRRFRKRRMAGWGTPAGRTATYGGAGADRARPQPAAAPAP